MPRNPNFMMSSIQSWTVSEHLIVFHLEHVVLVIPCVLGALVEKKQESMTNTIAPPLRKWSQIVNIWNCRKCDDFPCETCRSRYSLSSGGSRWKKQASMINTLVPPPRKCPQIVKISNIWTCDFSKIGNHENRRQAAKPMPIDAERVGLSFGRTFKSQSLLSAEKNTFFVLHMVFVKNEAITTHWCVVERRHRADHSASFRTHLLGPSGRNNTSRSSLG